MKTRNLLQLAVVALLPLSLNNPLSTALAQGSLTPPGAPGPMMKTLGQVEPREPISSVPSTITNGGSYYLTTNLVGATAQSGITISSGNVTLDLNGFALQGVPGSLDGIYFSGAYTNIFIRNGTINGWGGRGINAQAPAPSVHNLVLERLNISANANYGIQFNGSGATVVVRDCVCQSNALLGIYGIGNSLISGCVVSDNGGNGITAYDSIVRDCLVFNNASRGVAVIPGTVSGCFIHHNGASGISAADNGCLVLDNNCLSNNLLNNAFEAGILVNANQCRIENNHVTGSGHAGIQIYLNTNTNNLILKNTVIGNGANNYLTNNAGNAVGPLITTLGTITNSNPWANFSY